MAVIEDTNPLVKQLLIVVGICAGISIVIYLIVPVSSSPIQIIVAFPLLAGLIYSIAMMLLIYRRAARPLHIPLFLLGAVYIVGGAAFDIAATIIHTPRLDLEGNPIARALLDNGFAVSFVYLFGGIAQAMIVTLSCLLWAAFLRHVPEVVESAKAIKASSAAQFIKAACGAGHLSWRQWFFPLHIRDFGRAYHTLWLSVVFWMGALVLRWYFGFAWFGLLSLNVWIVGLIGSLISMTIYSVWLIKHYRTPQEQTAPSN